MAVFIGGLMIGRTPEYLGKKIQAKEMKLAAFGVAGDACHRADPDRGSHVTSRRAGGNRQPGPARVHRDPLCLHVPDQQQRLGLRGAQRAIRTFYNVLGAVAMLVGRFAIIVPSLAMAGILAAKNVVPDSLGTFKTDTPLFIGLLIGVILIVGGLTFFPAVSLGPIAEQLSKGLF